MHKIAKEFEEYNEDFHENELKLIKEEELKREN